MKAITQTNDGTPPEGDFSSLIDQQLELAVARLPALDRASVHPSAGDHDEVAAPHARLEDVLLGNAEASPELLEELAALQGAPALSDDELARQALEHGGGDDDPATPE